MAANSIEFLIREWEPKLQKAFLAAVYQIRDRAQIALITERLEKGDISGAAQAVGLDPVSFRSFDVAIAEAFESGGRYVATSFPVVRQPSGFRLNVQFDVRNFAAENWLRLHSSTAITQILDDQRVLIRQALSTAMERGVNPMTAALDLVGRVNATSGRREGGLLGLTSTQEQWVRNYADELASSNPRAALARLLRDKRFDAAVIRAAETGVQIPGALRNAMVTAYRNRALRYRGETIGRVEAMASIHEAQRQSYDQAIAKGAVDATAITQTWRTASDKKVRDSHASMQGQKVGFNEMFISGNGNMLAYPGDPTAPIEDVANCRCHVTMRIDHARGLK